MYPRFQCFCFLINPIKFSYCFVLIYPANDKWARQVGLNDRCVVDTHEIRNLKIKLFKQTIKNKENMSPANLLSRHFKQIKIFFSEIYTSSLHSVEVCCFVN